MPDPSPLRPEESEEAREQALMAKVEAFCIKRRINMAHERAIADLLRSERRDAMEKAAKIAAREARAYKDNAELCQSSELPFSAAADIHGAMACEAVAAAIRREMGATE